MCTICRMRESKLLDADGRDALVHLQAASPAIDRAWAADDRLAAESASGGGALAQAPVGPSDVSGDVTTTGALAIGGQASGALDVVGDHDWYRVTLTAGQTYEFRTRAGPAGTEVDTTLRLRTASGTELAYNDDSSGLFSRIRFTATTSGTYYLDVGGFDEAETGAYIVTAAIGTPPGLYTNDQIARQLTSDGWGGGSHRFSTSAGGAALTVDITGLTTSGQFLAREALALWSDATGLRFVEVMSSGANIVFDDAESGAFASASYSGGITTQARVNVGTDWLQQNGSGLNSYSFMTYLHEIGHALGLAHAGDYDGDASYPNDALFLNDSWSTTIMSYFDQQENTYTRDRGFTRQFTLSPMAADVLAANNLYGAASTTRTGDTMYGFGNSSGRAVYDAATYPGAAYTIVDHGGVDTLNYSGFSGSLRIDLNPESFSNIGGRVGNVSIARGSVIENAVGGSGADVLVGNSANNLLTGGAGNDEINGGAGVDTAVFSGARSGSTVSITGAERATVRGPDGTDLTIAVERFRFADGTWEINPRGFEAGTRFAIANFGAGAAGGGWESQNLYARTLADVNGDGRADIVGFGYGGTYVSLANANGTFGDVRLATANFGVGGEAGGWASGDRYPRMLADVNGDGRADIVGFGDAATYVSLGTADGGFSAAFVGIANFGAGGAGGGWESQNLFVRTLADVSGDGRADIVGFGHAGTFVSLANANGTFGEARLAIANYGAGAEAGGWANQNLYARLLADVNGDGRADIVGFGHSATYVALGTTGGGFATAAVAIANFGVGAEAGGWTSADRYPRVLADVNGDGFDDIVGFGEAGAYLSLANGTGGFNAAQLASNAFGAGAGAGGWASNDLFPRMLADVNGDGLADIVGFGNDGVSLALGAALIPIA